MAYRINGYKNTPLKCFSKVVKVFFQKKNSRHYLNPLFYLIMRQDLPKVTADVLLQVPQFLCAIATSSFSNEKNHVAEIEAWVLYISYVLALAERWETFPIQIYKDEFEIATQSIYNSLAKSL